TGADPPFTHRSTQATDFSDASACFAAHIESTMEPFSSAPDAHIEASTTSASRTKSFFMTASQGLTIPFLVAGWQSARGYGVLGRILTPPSTPAAWHRATNAPGR